MSKPAITVQYDGASMRLDKVLVAELGVRHRCSRSQLERWIKEGRIAVNGAVVVKASHKVERGDCIEVSSLDEPTTDMVPYAFALSILYEDDNLLVINKPSGLSMHPGAGNANETLANAIVGHVGSSQRSVGESDRPGIVHRLDKDTTGVIVVAKSTPVHAALAKQFSERTIDRTYRALVFTTPRARRPVQLAESGEVNAPIGRHPTNRKVMAIVEHGKPASTQWRVVERFAYGTLIECRLLTGRTHQIRVHMNSIGSPIIGDRVYGDFASLPARLREVADRFGRQALHACTLSFTHPTSKERMSFSAALPQDFEGVLEEFRRYA